MSYYRRTNLVCAVITCLASEEGFMLQWNVFCDWKTISCQNKNMHNARVRLVDCE